MTRPESTYDFGEEDFPALDIADQMHLHRIQAVHGRDRVTRWLRGNVAIPIQYQVDDDFTDTDAEAYYEALTDYFLREQ